MSFRLKLLLGILFTSIFGFTVLIASRISAEYALVYNRELQRVLSIGKVLADEVQENIIQRDTIDLQNILYLVKSDLYINVISVINNNDIVTFSTDSSIVGLIAPFKDSKSIWSSSSVFFISFYLPYAPPYLGSRLQIGYSLQNVHRELRNAWFWSFFFDLIITGETLVIAWYISGILIRPISKIQEAAERISHGDFSPRLEPESKDEIGQLTIAINIMATSLQDLTENLQRKIDDATRELVASNNRLKELDKLKSDFIAMVSHELHTPLTSIIGFAKTMSKLNLPESQRKEFLSIIEEEGNHLAAIIEEYLDISKIESGNFSLNISSFDFYDLVNNVIMSIKQQYPSIDFKIMGNNTPIEADRDKLRRVMINIIDNAAKYASSKVSVEFSSSSNKLRVDILDNGPGIPEQERKMIFEKFYRSPSPFNKEKPGSGLGLSIARGIINAHGGKIWTEPLSVNGSRFAFIIPVKSKVESVNDSPNTYSG